MKNKLIYISDCLRVRTFLAIFNFWVNYSFYTQLLKSSYINFYKVNDFYTIALHSLKNKTYINTVKKNNVYASFIQLQLLIVNFHYFFSSFT